MKYRNWLIGLLSFNAISAVSGGLVLIAKPEWHPIWIKYTDFTSLYFPGVILFAIVGGSSLFALLSILKRSKEAILLTILASLIMIFWLIGEIASMHTFHWLQAIYFITSIVQLVIIFLLPEKKSLS